MPSVGVKPTDRPDRPDPLAQRLARWFESRLLDTVVPSGTVTRLYGLEVIDPDGVDTLDPCAVRVVFIAEASDEHDVLALPDARRVLDFDAAATVVPGWYPASPSATRPSSFAGRRRGLTVRVVATRP